MRGNRRKYNNLSITELVLTKQRLEEAVRHYKGVAAKYKKAAYRKGGVKPRKVHQFWTSPGGPTAVAALTALLRYLLLMHCP